MKSLNGKRLRRALLVVTALLVIAAFGAGLTIWALQYRPPQISRAWDSAPPAPVPDNLDWNAVGGNAQNSKFSPLTQISTRNVGRLERVWTYRTGEVTRRGEAAKASKFEATPIIADNKLVICTPFNRIAALDPASGRELWIFDARIDVSATPTNRFGCRGLAVWSDPNPTEGAPCAERLFMATNDRRLLAIDARDGTRCQEFGVNGELLVIPQEEKFSPWEVHINAAPAVVGDVVVVGSSISDSHRAAAPSGKVRAFDVRTGEPRWSFDPVPDANGRTGAANVWSSISTDAERGLVFLPTSSPSPDFFGGERQGNPGLANAIVAVRASSGEMVWAFQTVHHDLWDYDVPSAPALFTLRRDGKEIPALAFATKAGFLFVLNRETGKPLYKVIERRVPQSDVPGERTSPTQPFSTLPTLARQSFSAKESFGLVGFDKWKCQRQFANIRAQGLFTPPSLAGSTLLPGRAGGGEWGGVAIDPLTNRLIVNSNSFVEIIRLVPQEDYDGPQRASPMSGPQTGASYAFEAELAFSPLGMPCSPPPWGMISAIDLDTGRMAWQRPLGTTEKLAPFGIALNWGTPNFGGPLVTGGGIVFIAATMDNRFRAIRLTDGEELWSDALPAGGQASPMTYAVRGKQYVVIAAGGHAMLGTNIGDYVVAYALPD